jgi:hypothetical protein
MAEISSLCGTRSELVHFRICPHPLKETPTGENENVGPHGFGAGVAETEDKDQDLVRVYRNLFRPT